MIAVIPWVKLVAITGALAMENASEDDDIDFMIVTAANRLWIVRPMVIFLISLFFRRRRPLPNVKTNNQQLTTNNNEICLNLWLDESALEIPQLQRNLYAAHELAQMKPIVDKNETYERMMDLNIWGRRHLANTWERLNRQIDKWTNRQIDETNNESLLARPFIYLSYLSDYLFVILNRVFFFLQFQYMRSKMTTERVSLHAAFFHPGNRGQTILRLYKMALDKNKIDI